MAGRHQVPLRTFLWEYLGYPEDETVARRRILYAIVALRLGFGLFFLLHGWGAVFGAAAEALALRLGDPARLGLSGAAADTTLFILGCTELGVGALLLFGAFTRVSAVTGGALLLLALLLGDRSSLGEAATLVAFAGIASLGGLAVLIIAGSPFLSADRALDKLEEEERDRAPAVLPPLAERSALILRLGLVAACVWLTVAQPPVQLASGALAVNWYALIALLSELTALLVPLCAVVLALGIAIWALGQGNAALAVGVVPIVFVAVAYLLASPQWPRLRRREVVPLGG